MSGSATTGLVIVSHSARLAEGLVEVAAQMAPDVALRAAGGTDDGGIGTSYDKVDSAVADLLGVDGVTGVVLLTDLGSATMTAESVLDMLDPDVASRVVLADGPLVEGAVAGAVAAQGGADAETVARTVAEAAGSFAGPAAQESPSAGVASDGTARQEQPSAPVATGGTATSRPATTGPAAPAVAAATAPAPAVAAPADGDVLARTLVLHNDVGLHARPAALLARLVAGFDAQVTVNDVNAASVLALMGLGLEKGDQMEVRAGGAQAAAALEAVEQAVAEGFGEQ